MKTPVGISFLLFRLPLMGVVSLSISGAQLIDTFDDGMDDGWTVFDPLGGAGIADPAAPEFPNGAYRLMGTVPAIPDGGPARLFSFLDGTTLTDFYIAVDIVDWNDEINQAVGMVARADNIGLGSTTGYVCNYNPNQSGSNPSGQFQINYVENEGAPSDSTMAAANLELEDDHSYRMIFFGVGSKLTAAIYDLLDLTRPVALIETLDDDPRGELYANGAVGLFNFFRGDDVTAEESVSDTTYDNFVQEVENPDAQTWPAIARGIPGIPFVAEVQPASGENFASVTSGLRVLIDRGGIPLPGRDENAIVPSSVSLELNGLDVSEMLEVTSDDDGTTVTFGGLDASTIYHARLKAANTAGDELAHEWSFDTFDISVLEDPQVEVIEAENYNFDSGSFLEEAGVGTYADKFGELDVDYFDFDDSPRSDLRFDDFVAMQALNSDFEPEEVVIDTVRPGVEAEDDYVVTRTAGGEWMNYTRTFAPADYFVFLRAASRESQDILLGLVENAAEPNQSVTPLGVFPVGSTLSGQSFEFFQLVTDDGGPAAVSLGGTQTLRLTIGGDDDQFETRYSGFLNYLMLVPANSNSTPFAIKSVRVVAEPAPGIEVTWPSIPGFTYSVQFAASPAEPFLEITDLTADDTASTFVDSDAGRLAAGEGYYRVTELR